MILETQWCFNRSYNTPLRRVDSRLPIVFWIFFYFLLESWTGFWILLVTWNHWELKITFPWTLKLQTADSWPGTHFREIAITVHAWTTRDWSCKATQFAWALITAPETFQVAKGASSLHPRTLASPFLWSLTWFSFVFINLFKYWRHGISPAQTGVWPFCAHALRLQQTPKRLWPEGPWT